MEHYYIIIDNLCYKNLGQFSEYHIESVCHFDIGFIIDKELSPQKSNLLIVTDDNDLLSKYIFCLSKEDFLFLCDFSITEIEKIRLQKSYYTKYSERTTISIDKENLLHYFLKILNRDIISASITTINREYGYDELDNSIETMESIGWKENHLFRYLDVPEHYASRNYPKNYEKNIYGKLIKISQPEHLYLEELNSLINVDIRELQLNGNSDNKWEYYINGIYKYFDYKSFCRLYIKDEILEKLKNDDSLVLKCKTKFSENKYIEYHIYECVKK